MSAVDFGRCARTSTPPLRQSAARFEGRGEWLGPSCAHLAAPAPSLASTASAPENRACSPPAGASVALRRCARAHGWSSRPPPRCRRPRIASRSPRWRARQARAHSARVTSRLRARGTLACSWASQWPARPRERSRRPGAAQGSWRVLAPFSTLEHFGAGPASPRARAPRDLEKPRAARPASRAPAWPRTRLPVMIAGG